MPMHGWRPLHVLMPLALVVTQQLASAAGVVIPAGGAPIPDAFHIGCGAMFPVLVGMTAVGCTHGPDPAPPGIDPSVPRPLPGRSSQPVPGVATELAAPRVPCYGDGQSGARVQAIYAYPADKADRYARVAPNITRWASEMDQVFDKSARQTGGVRHVRFVTDTNCNLVVLRVRLTSSADDTFGNTITELRAMGFDQPDRKYLVWMDSTVLCGIAGYYVDDRAGSDNANNGTLPGNVARIDSGCWGLASRGQSVEAHELMHTLGGVQASAPHATPLGHCTDGADRMCYDDGSGLAQRSVCSASNEAYFDCKHDDYYSTKPVAGSYLGTHWDTAHSQFLATRDPPVTAAPPAPTPNASPSPASSPPSSVVPSGRRPGALGGAASRLRALRPARILDARSGVVGSNHSRDLTVAGRGGVPTTGAVAAVLSVTVVASTANSGLSVYPTGRSRPTNASVLFAAHRRRSSLVVVPLGDNGMVRLANRNGSVRVSVDVVGWFDADGGNAPGQIQTVPTARIFDTARGIGGPRGRLRAGTTRRLVVTGRGGTPTGGVSAVWLNVTASHSGAAGSVSFGPARHPPHLATTLTYPSGHATSTLVLAPVGRGGAVFVHTSKARVDISADVVGWVDDGSNAAPSRFSAVTPATVFDTRSSGSHRPMPSHSARDVQVTGRGGVPASGVAAVILAVEVEAPTADGSLGCGPAGQRRSVLPSVRYWRSTGAAQTVLAEVDSKGRITVSNVGGSTNVRIDVVGYLDTG